MTFKIPRIQLKFRTMVISLVLIIGLIMTVAQYFLQYSYSEDVGIQYERSTIKLFEANLPSMLVYPMGMRDKQEIHRIAKEVVQHDFIYSIEIRDENGELLDYTARNEESNTKSVNIKTIYIISFNI